MMDSTYQTSGRLNAILNKCQIVIVHKITSLKNMPTLAAFTGVTLTQANRIQVSNIQSFNFSKTGKLFCLNCVCN